MASEYERIEAEIKIRQEVDYERGYREGYKSYKKGKSMQSITTTFSLDTYNVGLSDGFKAASRGKLNKYG